ncbi:MAG TPA: hypothetical protein DCG83_01105 [Cryomorphaceae bacterium]|nr:hypothetical protein [Cryomorphaceae bacterium]
MDRRSFLKKSALGTAGFAIPTILPTGSLFAATGSRRVNHVVFCLFAGGVRNVETIFKNEGNLMPAMIKGSSSISSDIAGGITAMPTSPLSKTLQEYGTLFTNVKFIDGPTGHFNGHTSAITGQHTTSTLSLRDNPPFPTVFELYRKHNSPVHAAKNAWWVSRSNNLYPLLNHSTDPSYGVQYAANQIAPNSFFSWDVSANLKHELEFTGSKAETIDDLRKFMDSNFTTPVSLNNGVVNNKEDRLAISNWITSIQNQVTSGQLNNPWGVNPWMSGDQYNIFYAEELIKTFQPELLVVSMFDVDTAHSDFTGYCSALHRADYGVAHLWDTIQNTPGMKDDTIMIVMPEIGRNQTTNNLVDIYGRLGLDHTNGDPLSRDVFCMVVGPPGVVNQDKTENALQATVDVVPTIADILGFEQDIPISLPGQSLLSAFV